MKKIIFTLILIIFCLFLYGKYIEVNNLKIKEYTINANVPNSFKELKIIHFSDILYKGKDSQKKLEEIVTKINEQKADIIIFSGDLFDKDESYSNEDFTNIKKNLKNMNANLFKFAVIGDNDKEHLESYRDVLYESDFTILDNENKLIFYKDTTPINIIGLTSTENINDLFTSDISYNYTLAIMHEPDNLSTLSKYNIDTILSGHSLGGIISIPFFGGVAKKDGAKTYINDTYILDNTKIFVSNGIGYEKYEFRLFNTPSINVYRFEN